MAPPAERQSIPMVSRPIRVLIVDDSAVARAVLGRIVDEDPRFALAATVNSAYAALDYVRQEQVDIVILDIEMPGMTGLAALPQLLRADPGLRILILSSACEEGGTAAIEAMAQGACDTLSKPGRNSFAGRFSHVLLDRLAGIGRREDRRSGTTQRPVEPVALRGEGAAGAIGCIALGSSTGGIHALAQFFDALGPPVGVPILITQHLPESFIPYFARQLQEMTGRTVHVAEQGQILRPDHIYLAPGHAHLECRATRHGVAIHLNEEREALACMPSVDPMLRSLAEVYGQQAIGIILSGMGRDGLVGAGAVATAGGRILAQDAQSSVVWGMPGAVARAGIVNAVLPPERLASFVLDRLGRR